MVTVHSPWHPDKEHIERHADSLRGSSSILSAIAFQEVKFDMRGSVTINEDAAVKESMAIPELDDVLSSISL
jgi:hypothetical protein